MGLITAKRITDLKAKVKAECQRRKYKGSVTTYAGTAYDFTVAPTQGGKALQEHHDKLSVPLSAINSDKVAANNATAHQKMTEVEMANMEAWVTQWAKTSIYSNTSDCKASCTGLCSGCQGCTDCSGCDGCTDCSGCSGCGSCGGCGGCNGECASDCETICS